MQGWQLESKMVTRLEYVKLPAQRDPCNPALSVRFSEEATTVFVEYTADSDDKVESRRVTLEFKACFRCYIGCGAERNRFESSAPAIENMPATNGTPKDVTGVYRLVTDLEGEWRYIVDGYDYYCDISSWSPMTIAALPLS